MSRPRQLAITLTCTWCGKETTYFPSQIKQGMGRFCSRKCKHESMQGQLFPNPHHPTKPVGHRIMRADGYVAIKVREGTHTYELEHRVVAAEKYGRPIGKDEHIHHLNGIRSDNRPENLEVVAPGDHARLSNQQGVVKRQTMRRELAELERYRKKYGPLPPVLEPQEDERNCDFCGKSYHPAKPSYVRESRYCSIECRMDAMHSKVKEFHASRRPDPVICQQCGESFEIPPYREGEAKYCSKACANAALQKDNPEKPCEYCGTMFRKRTTKETAKARYCSQRCSNLVMTALRLKDYVEPEPKMCAYCAQSYRPRTQSEAAGNRYCSRACWRGAHARPTGVQLRIVSEGA